jgi:hypothetical protein
MRNIVLLTLGLFTTSIVGLACTDLTGPESPETPVNVTATLLTGTSARIEWQASPQSDGVVSYNIHRNGTKVGESPSTSFTDVGLAEQTKYEYSVSANCLSGRLSDPSAVTAASTITTADLTPPKVTAVSPLNGSVGVSLVAYAVVQFSEAMDPATLTTATYNMKITATGALIPGTVIYTPSNQRAEFHPNTSLPSAQQITITVTNGAKDIHGNALSPVFTSTFTTRDEEGPRVTATNPTNGAGNVSSTAPNISITFSEPLDATTVNNNTVTLRLSSSGAFVPGTVAYVAATRTATFTPASALSQGVNYTVTAASSITDVAGNALGADFQFTFTTGDTSAPFLILATPANLTTNVATNTTVKAAFNEAMNPATINTTTFTVRAGGLNGALVPGTVVYDVPTATATFTPTSALAASTAYVVTVTTGAKDLASNALAASTVPNPWTFTTAAPADNTAPTVTGVNPSNGTNNVNVATDVLITFSEAMDQATINNTNITVKNTATNSLVSGVVTYNPATFVATFNPDVSLAQGTGYTVTVSTAVKDVAGNALAAQFTSTFTTQPAPDNTAPTIVSISPANGTTAPPNTKVYVTFSEPMDQTTINNTNVTLKVTSSSAAVPGTVTYNAAQNMAIFSPTSALTPSTGYTLTVTTGVKDVAGNALAAQATSTFTTTAGADAVAPTVTAVSPTNGASGVDVNSPVAVTFSEAMDPTTINGTTFTVKVTSSSAAVAGSISYNSTTHVATFTPTSSLAAGTGYTVTVTTGVKDLAQNAMAAQFTSTFTTAP